MNLYAYVRNDPVNFVDPLGLREFCHNVDTSFGSGVNWTVQSRRICVEWPDFGFRELSGVSDGGGIGLKVRRKPDPQPEKDTRMNPSTKKYLCGKLGDNGFNVPKTYRDVLSDRHTQTNGRSNWGVPEFREAENFLYATGQWRSPATDGSTYVGVYAHQFSKYVFSNTSDFSWDALYAGLDGVDHKNNTPVELKAFCNAN